MNPELFAIGLQVRREVFGAEHADKGEIAEVFLQAAIYCGVPAAIDSFRAAQEVFAEMGI